MEAIIDSTEALTLPLSPEQRAVLSMRLGDSTMHAPSMALLADIEGQLDAQRLRAALEAVLHAHGILRHAFRHVDGYWGLRQQCLGEMPPLDWQQVNLRGHADQDMPTALANWLYDFRVAPLAVEHGQLLRAALVRTGEARSTLALALSALVADRGSLQCLFDQIAASYLGNAAFDPAEVIQYAQFVEWRQGLADGEDAHQGRNRWAQYLCGADALSPLRLSYRQSNTHLPGVERIQLARSIDAEQVTRIAAIAGALGARAELLMQAAWWLLLARLTGFGRFVGGWQNDCRRDYEVMQGAVGVFDKVLPVVVDAAADESFSDWFARLAGVASAHIEAQEYWAVDAPPITAHLAVGFAASEAPRAHGVDPLWRVSELPGPMPFFELAMQVAWGEGGAEFTVHAEGSRYTQAAVERLLQQFSTLLEGVLAQPAARVLDLPLVGPEEREALLAMNADRAEFGTRSVAEHIARWAELTPDAPVIEAGERRLNYRQFVAQANRMAHWLQAQGVAPGALVALNMPRSVDLVVAMLAVWRTGAGYLPLEPEWPDARRRAVLADAKPALVFHAALPADAPASAQKTPWREEAFGGIDLNAFADSPPGHEIALNDLAYVLYTSGSTGQPKGVVIEHGQLLNYVAAASAAMDLGACRRWALTSSVAADLGNTALFGALFNGTCLVVAGPDDTKDADGFSRFMAERGIDGLKMVPSHLEALLECDSPRLPCTLVLGGEAAPRTLIERIARLAPECAIYNHYGPTETTVGVMVHTLRAQSAIPEILSLSRVLANNRIYVFDEAMHLVPSGAMGEVYIGGAQVCRGYLNREGEGAFVADPFQPGERLYRAGDLAYVLPEGGIRLVGRLDQQVKIRGFRVEPAEVESALVAQTGVRQAVVMPLSSETASVELGAFLVVDAELASDVGRQSLRDRLSALLPAHMLPASYVFVLKFPQLPNGKIDRLALAAMPETYESQRTETPPQDALEFVLADCIAKLLGRKFVGIEDDFFELGGHSLLVIKLVARIRKLLQVEIAPALVFDHPTPATLAAALRSGDREVARLEKLAEVQRQLATLAPDQGAALESQARQDSCNGAQRVG